MGDSRGDSASKELDSGPDVEESRRKKVKIPDKKKYDEEMDAIARQIKQKEDKLASITAVRPDSSGDSSVGGQREALLGELRRLKARRESVLEERRKLELKLQQTNTNVQKMREALTKLQSGLKFKSEPHVDDAIKKLEQQLQTQRLSLSEEKRVVTEISTLKASKRSIQEYVALREKIDAERAQQNKLRDEREAHFKQLTEFRQEEEKVKTQLDGMKGKQDQAWTEFKQRISEKDAIRKEIDELYTRKKELAGQNKKQLDVYYEGMRAQRKARREEELRRKEEDRRVAHEAHQKEMNEYLKMREPYKQERDLCTALTAYLTPLGAGLITGSGEAAAGESIDEDRLVPVRSNELKIPQGMFRRKKDDDVALSGLFGGKSKGKKGKKGKKGASTQKSSRPLNHNPAIFDQFLSLGLRAPNSSSDVQDVLQQLTDKRTYFETLAAEEKATQSGQREEESVSMEKAEEEEEELHEVQEPVVNEDASEETVAVGEQGDEESNEPLNDGEQVEKETDADVGKDEYVVPIVKEEADDPKLKEDEEKPDEDEEKPDEDEEKPDEDEEKPVEDEEKPDEDEEKPVEDEEKPVEDEEKPDEDEEKPVEDEEKPDEDEEKPVEDEEKPDEHHMVASENAKEGHEVESQATKDVVIDDEEEPAVWESEVIEELVETKEDEFVEDEIEVVSQDDRHSNGDMEAEDKNVSNPVDILDAQEADNHEDLQVAKSLEHHVEDKQADESVVIGEESQAVDERGLDGDKPQDTGSTLTNETLQFEGTELSHCQDLQPVEGKTNLSSVYQIEAPLEAPVVEENVSPEVEHAKTEVIDADSAMVLTDNVTQTKSDEEDVQCIARSMVPVSDDGLLTVNDLEESTKADSSQQEQASTDIDGSIEEKSLIESTKVTDEDNDTAGVEAVEDVRESVVDTDKTMESQMKLVMLVNGDTPSHVSSTESSQHKFDSSQELEQALTFEIDHVIESNDHQEKSGDQTSPQDGNGSGQEVDSVNVTEETVTTKVDTLQHQSPDAFIDDTLNSGAKEEDHDMKPGLSETVRALVGSDDDAGSGTEV